MQFTTVRSKEKDYDIYLKSEKLVHSHWLGARKKWISQLFRSKEKDYDIYLKKKLVPSSQLFGSGNNWFLAISTNTVAAIWREKKVDPCYLETKKCSSQLFGARKKIMTSI